MKISTMGLSWLALAAFLAAGADPARGQIGGNGSHGVYAPAVNDVLDTTQNGGVFQFTRIHVPPGVEVKVTGPNPAVFLSQGDVLIEGRLLADGETPPMDGWPGPGRGGPGGWSGGMGNRQFGSWLVGETGGGPAGGRGGDSLNGLAHGAGGGHATQGVWSSGGAWGPVGRTYGSAFPFELRGGSGGGGGIWPGSSSLPSLPGFASGSGGGGALAVLSDGRIVVEGLVSARGGNYHMLRTSGWGGCGAGGAILLRALGGVGVAASGEVLATGGWHIWSLSTPHRKSGGDGWIRIDSYDSPPDLVGTVDPSPLAMRLPALRETAAARPGAAWRAALVAVPGDTCFVLLSGRQGNLPVPPFGILEVHPMSMFLLGPLHHPASGIDPHAEIALQIPNDPRLVGARFFVQAFNHLTATGRPRLTNASAVTISQ